MIFARIPPSYTATSSPPIRCRCTILVAELRTCFACFNGRIPNAFKTRRADSLTNPSLSARSRLRTCDVLLFSADTSRTRLQVCGLTFFFAWPKDRESLRRWAIPDAPSPCFCNAINFFDDVRLIAGGDDFPIIENPIETKYGSACVASTCAFSTISTWGNFNHATLFALGGFPLYRGQSQI